MRDYRVQRLPTPRLWEEDADRIGIWGSSYSGGHVLVVGAIDHGRVKCVVAQEGAPGQRATVKAARRLIRADYLAGVQKLFEDDFDAPAWRARPPV